MEKEREGLGSEFLEAVEKMVQAIAKNPERFPAIRKIFAVLCCPVSHTAFSIASFQGMSW
jgi:hypothetical protein